MQALSLPRVGRGGYGGAWLKKQTQISWKSYQEAEKSQGSMQRKLNNIEKYNTKTDYKYSLGLCYLPGPSQVCVNWYIQFHCESFWKGSSVPIYR